MKISIITPSYNQGEFIAQTFESVLAQANASLEIEYIVMDACSTDLTDTIVKRYIPKFAKKRIRFLYFREKDNGQTDAINKGIARSSGDVITYLNSDDYYQSDVLKGVADFFVQNPQIQWAYGGWNYVNKQGKVYSTISPKLYSYEKLLDYCVVGQPSCFFRNYAWVEIGAFDETLHLGMDYDYWLRLSQRFPAGIIPKVISNMRYYGGTKSGSQATAHLIEAFKLSTRYTPFFSWKRFVQLFYFLRGYLVIVLGVDITRRIERGV